LHFLASNGILLTHHYTHPVCTPSRAALMTGFYATKTRAQNAIWEWQPMGLDQKLTLLPGYLKNLGYETYAVGK